MQKEAFEPTGLIPRSIIRTFDRFWQQLLPGSEHVAIQEYRVSRYQILVSIQSLFVLVSIPIFVNCGFKSLLLMPLTEHVWNSGQKEIFLNAYQERRAFTEMQDFSERMFFESLLLEVKSDVEEHNLKLDFQKKSLELADKYNHQSIVAISNTLCDLVSLATLYIISVLMKPQIIILKSFLIESIYSLSDTTKSFLLILLMDLLVGFHSPRGWELALENILQHFGLPENENFVLLFVALFPVFLDTVFKYWIFRYLNKISPSTVVTYHSMLE